MMALKQASDHDQASVLHVSTASQNSMSMLQQEIGEQVLGITGGYIQSPTIEEKVIKYWQVLDPTNEGYSSPALYTELYALDMRMNCSNTSSPQNSPAHTPSLTPEFNQYLSSGEDTSSAFFEANKMISEDNSHIVQHSMEDIVHAEIFTSLKTGATAGEIELSSNMEERPPELPSRKRRKRKFEDSKSEHLDSSTDSLKSLNDKQKTDVEGTGVDDNGYNALSDVQKRKRFAMYKALEDVLPNLKEVYTASQTLYPFHRVNSGRTNTRDIYLSTRLYGGLLPYKCGICGKMCVDCINLSHHIKSHKARLIYRCDVCGKDFQHSFSFECHLELHENENASTAGYSNKGRGTLGSKSSAEKSNYKCKVCGKMLRRGDELKVHMQYHQSETWKICMKELSKLSYHMRKLSIDTPYRCNICDKSFGFSGALSSHVESHMNHKNSRIRNKRRMETDKCAKNDHLSSQDTSVSSYTYPNYFGRLQCWSCSKSFSSRHQFQNHAVYHSEPKFKCRICDIAFYHKYQLQLHQISHTGFPRHVCKWCNQSFLSSFSLRLHTRIHTSIRLLHIKVKPCPGI